MDLKVIPSDGASGVTNMYIGRVSIDRMVASSARPLSVSTS